MKKVFSNSEVPHIWARQSQEDGRGSNIFFNRTKIYSYGYHFCMANIIQPGIVFITDRKYSNSTAKHLSNVRHAVNHLERVYVPYPELDSLKNNFNSWVDRIKEQIGIIENTRKKPETKERAKGDLSNLVSTVNRFCEVIDLDLTKRLKSTEDEKARKEFILYLEVAKDLQALPALQTKLKKREQAEAREQKKKDAKRIEEAKKELLKWRAGKVAYLHFNHSSLPVYLRTNNTIHKDEPKETIQTSAGARVSYNAGKLLYKMIETGRDVKGHDIDGYTVISVNGVLKIGCHKIDMKEVKRFAKAEGWTK